MVVAVEVTKYKCCSDHLQKPKLPHYIFFWVQETGKLRANCDASAGYGGMRARFEEISEFPSIEHTCVSLLALCVTYSQGRKRQVGAPLGMRNISIISPKERGFRRCCVGCESSNNGPKIYARREISKRNIEKFMKLGVWEDGTGRCKGDGGAGGLFCGLCVLGTKIIPRASCAVRRAVFQLSREAE